MTKMICPLSAVPSMLNIPFRDQQKPVPAGCCQIGCSGSGEAHHH